MWSANRKESKFDEAKVKFGILIQRLRQYWASLERGWQAICFATVLVLAISFGVSIPW
jgi:hypothetical protein